MTRTRSPSCWTTTPPARTSSPPSCAKQAREFAHKHEHHPFLRRGPDGRGARPDPREGAGRPGRGHRGRRLPHLHLRRAGRLLHRHRLHRHGRGHGHRPAVVQGALRHQGDPEGEAPALCQRQGCDPAPDRRDRGGRRPVSVPGVRRGGRVLPVHGRPLHHLQHGHRGRRQERHLPRGREDHGVYQRPGGPPLRGL